MCCLMFVVIDMLCVCFDVCVRAGLLVYFCILLVYVTSAWGFCGGLRVFVFRLFVVALIGCYLC